MCLAIPARITAIDAEADTAIVALGSVRKQISLTLMDDAVVGDYVLLHVGYALSRINPEEAERTLRLISEIGAADEAARGLAE